MGMGRGGGRGIIANTFSQAMKIPIVCFSILPCYLILLTIVSVINIFFLKDSIILPQYFYSHPFSCLAYLVPGTMNSAVATEDSPCPLLGSHLSRHDWG